MVACQPSRQEGPIHEKAHCQCILRSAPGGFTGFGNGKCSLPRNSSPRSTPARLIRLTRDVPFRSGLLWGTPTCTPPCRWMRGDSATASTRAAPTRLARGEEDHRLLGSAGDASAVLSTGWRSPTIPTAWGFINDTLAASPLVTQFEQGARWSKGFQGRRPGGGERHPGADHHAGSQGKVDPETDGPCTPRRPALRHTSGTTWSMPPRNTNDPGEFTTFIGFEWTSLVKGGNLHRNVIFRDNGDRARQVVPYTTAPPDGQHRPARSLQVPGELRGEDQRRGHDARAQRQPYRTASCSPLMPSTRAGSSTFYAEQRAKWERIYEITQIKGDGEAHPFLSPDDEFADYGTWDVGNLDLSEAKTDDMLAKRVCPRSPEERTGPGKETGNQPLQVRLHRRHRQSHLVEHGGGETTSSASIPGTNRLPGA